jgi:hypothetical protein
MTTTTTNYGWVKPDVGASDDVWGGYINTDLDGIDAIVKGVSVVANAAYPASNPSGYQTAAQVASVVIGDNRIINGDMRIDQRNGGALINPAVNGNYTVDRWLFQAAQSGRFSSQRNLIGITPPSGFPYYLGFQSLSAYTPLAADTFLASQSIEADMLSDFAWGTAAAQPVTLSFWAYSGLTGTFSGAICNYANTRAYPFIFSLPNGGAWTKITLTIPGDTAGTWVMSGNGGGVSLRFDLGSGANFRAAAGAWTAGNIVGVNGAVNVVSTSGAVLFLTGVKLEIGSVATPFNRQSLAKSMADCQRYFQAGTNIALEGYSGGASSIVGGTIWFQVMMRSSPTLTQSGASYSNGSALALDQASPTACRALWTGNSASRSAINGLTFTASAEL